MVQAEFLEKYVQLSELDVGRVAVSKDRKTIFYCLWVPTKDVVADSHKAIIKLNDPHDQYIFKLDLNQPVKILERGDKFVFTV
jgi:hypothetical protein